MYPAQSSIIREKRRQTCIENWGVEYPLQSPIIREKMKQTCVERLGVEYAPQSPMIYEKIRQTCVELFGTKSPMQSPIIREKHERVIMERFGCRNVSQSPEIQKTKHNRYSYFGIAFDSSWELYYYIYQIKILRANCVRNYGEVYFEYFVNDKAHRYIPDFITDCKIVEIKGSHLFDGNSLIDIYDIMSNEMLKAKTQCMLENVDEIITRKEIIPMIKEVKRLFGAHYIDQFKVKKDEEGLKAS